MKKNYCAPQTILTEVKMQDSLLMTMSVTGSDHGIGWSEEPTTEPARVKQEGYDVWDEDWSK